MTGIVLTMPEASIDPPRVPIEKPVPDLDMLSGSVPVRMAPPPRDDPPCEGFGDPAYPAPGIVEEADQAPDLLPVREQRLPHQSAEAGDSYPLAGPVR